MDLRGLTAFCFLLHSFLISVAADLHAPVVQTELGVLRGQTVSVKGSNIKVDAFLGVPFAKPPVGPSLRLAAPQPPEGWEGVRDATRQPLMCIQSTEYAKTTLEKLGIILAYFPEISEDCLYLNIYTPANRAPDAKLPVMVWIHGGSFLMGSASTYEGSGLAANQDVVVVVIQYRLGLLGFLSTGDENMSGNFGMLDQIEALKWVQKHIHNFGGNPDSVTIFGESAGGVSVSLLLLSPLSDGLFHRAIAESGTAAMHMLLIDDPMPVAQSLAIASGCSLESTKTIADCMKNLNNEAIVTFANDAKLRYPVNVDGHFLTKPVTELFEMHELLTVPFLTGVNNHEGGWLLADAYAPRNWTEGLDKDDLGDIFSMFFPDPKDAHKPDLLIDEYSGSGEDRLKNRDGFTEMLGDLLFTVPAIKTVNAHKDAGAAVYLYEYQYAPQFLQKKRPSFVKCDHGDELFTAFGLCFTSTHVKLSDACAEEEEEFSRTMMSYWGNFARTGSPNGDGLVHWPRYGWEEKYLEIDLKTQVVKNQLKKERFIFHTQILEDKMKQQ